jgi:hypothetical protein
MKNPNYRFVRFWERTRRINKWRFVFPVGVLSGLILLGGIQFFHSEQTELIWFFSELITCLATGIFLVGPLAWSRNEKKFIRTLRAIQQSKKVEWQLIPSTVHHVSSDLREAGK